MYFLNVLTLGTILLVTLAESKASRNDTQTIQPLTDSIYSKENLLKVQGETQEDRSPLDNRMIDINGDGNKHLSDGLNSDQGFEMENDEYNTRNGNGNTYIQPYTSSAEESQLADYSTTSIENKCDISVLNKSVQFFQSQLLTSEPHFVQFRIRPSGNTTPIGSTKDVFQGERWYWTYNTSTGPFPFLSWNLDYGLLSFGLLDAKTIHIPYVELNVSGCNITYGSTNTSNDIARALKVLVDFKDHSNELYIQFRESYFCFLVADETLRNTLQYVATQYILYPCSFIRYKCCTVNFDYENQNLTHKCPKHDIPGIQTWAQTSIVPFVLGILLLFFCPIPMFQLLAWTAKRDRIVSNDYEPIFENSDDGFQIIEEEENWIYADGISSPLMVGDLISFEALGLYDKCPIFTSRLRRLLCLVFAPSVIYFEVILYRNGLGMWAENDKITVEDLVKVGTPMGFISLLADPLNEHKTFAPGLGGPLVVTVIYFLFGFLFIVLPRCLKQIVEDGLPRSNLYIPSPLFFGYKEILKMSQINIEPDRLEPGYTKGSALMKCSFYLLFTTKFWIRVWRIQSRRISCISESTSLSCCALFVVIFPLYLLLCILEIVLCLMYYGIPFCFFTVVMVKGAAKALGYLRRQGRILSWLFSFKIFILIGVTVVGIIFTLLAYVAGLMIIKSFVILTQIIALCFIAVIIYPSVSFGYLFFIVIVLYYFMKQIRNFSDVYAELLSSAVHISKAMSQDQGKVTFLDGYLNISNVNFESLKGIRINGNIIDESQDLYKGPDNKRDFATRKKNDVYGIPKGLFEFLVKKHRPVHKQILLLVFKVAIMIAFIMLTWSISSNYVSGPTTEISEVMHVVFIVVVGVIPQLIGIAFSNSNSALVQEVEKRKIERLIDEYYLRA